MEYGVLEPLIKLAKQSEEIEQISKTKSEASSCIILKTSAFHIFFFIDIAFQISINFKFTIRKFIYYMYLSLETFTLRSLKSGKLN